MRAGTSGQGGGEQAVKEASALGYPPLTAEALYGQGFLKARSADACRRSGT